MPDGIKYLLSPGRQKNVTILTDEGTSLFVHEYIKELYDNFMQEESLTKAFIILSWNPSALRSSLEPSKEGLEIFNYFEEGLKTPEELLETLTKKHTISRCPVKILVIDDFSLFSRIIFKRESSKIRQFFMACNYAFQKLFVFSHRECLFPSEMARLYENSSSLGLLSSHISDGNVMYYCDIVKVKPESRVTHERSRFQIINGKINEINNVTPNIGDSDEQMLLKSLTTFKLTVEDEEKESRSKLYLPYFDAQSTTLNNPDDFEEYDDEDEEV